MTQEISQQERDNFYKVLYGRRDVRSLFLKDSIPEDCLMRVLHAAHHAPSVGLSEPWSFVVVSEEDTKQRVYNAFCKANAEATELFEGERKALYKNLKLQGILDAPINVLVTCDRDRGGSVVLGKTHQPEMDVYSSVCAVQNLWLAARAENIGMGWVSIIHPQALIEIFKLPENIVPIAYLCLGYVEQFDEQPELETRGWAKRGPLEDVVFRESWQVSK